MGNLRLRLASIWGMAAMLSGCASLETGYIDYRRAEDPVDVTKKIAEYPAECAKDIDTSNKQKSAGFQSCKPLLGVRVFRKNVSRKTGIQPEDVYSIRLDYGYMQYVSEVPFTVSKLIAGKSPFRARAEIVVLARAFEFDAKPVTPANKEDGAAAPAAGGAETPVASEASFVDLDSQSLNAARVIYYSPDVENGQGLNFSNIPIIGPVAYSGRPVGIQIIVLELDKVSEEMKGLLSSLASLGQAAGALPTGGASSILTDLGKTLLESNQDDVVFEYRFVLDRTVSQASYNAAPFEEGRYVLRRLHYRNYNHIWRNLELDHNTGQLFVWTKGADGSDEQRPFTDDTYFTVNIVNHGRGAAEAAYVNRKLSDLRTAIEASATADNRTITQIDTDLKASAKALRGDIYVRNLTQAWEKVEISAQTFANNIAPATVPAGGVCTLTPKPIDRNKAQFELLKAVSDFTTGWADAVSKNAQNNAQFGAAEQRRVAGNVGSFFIGTDDVGGTLGTKATTADMFIDDAQFNALLTRPAPDGFADTVLAYGHLLAPKSCYDLIALGLAK